MKERKVLILMLSHYVSLSVRIWIITNTDHGTLHPICTLMLITQSAGVFTLLLICMIDNASCTISLHIFTPILLLVGAVLFDVEKLENTCF